MTISAISSICGLQVLVFAFEFLDTVDQFSSGGYGHMFYSFRILDLVAPPFGVALQRFIFNFGGPV